MTTFKHFCININMSISKNYSFDYEKFKKNHKKHSKLSIFLTYFVVFLTILLSVGAFSYIFYFKGIGTFKKTNNLTYYLLSSSMHADYDKALSYSSEIQNRGGAGYIYKYGQYYVILNAYFSKTDAEKVLNKTKKDYPASKIIIYKIEFNKSRLNDINKNLINVITKNIETSYNIVLSLDTNEITTKQATNMLRTLNSNMKSSIEEYKSHFTSYSSDTQKIIENLLTFNEYDSNIINTQISSIELSPLIKYSYIAKIIYFNKICSYF